MRGGLFGLAVTSCVVGNLTSCGEIKSSRVTSGENQSKPVYVRVPSSILSESWVRATGFNRDHAKNDEFALGWISASRLTQISTKDSSGITRLDERAVTEGRLNPFTSETIMASFDAPTPAEDYHNYQAMTDELRNLADSHPEIASLSSIGKTVQGRDIWMMTISDNVDADEREPELLYIANMHGDEVVGREMSIYHIRRLLNEYGQNTRVTNLVNNSKMFIVASMNPDGFEDHQRWNGNNADLNRDFPDFTSDDHDSPSSREIETKAVMDLHTSHHFASAVNFHGGEVCFNLPWDTKPNRSATEKFGDDTILKNMGRTYADSNATMVANNHFDRGLTYGYEWYEVDGGMQDWSIWYRQSMHATIELSYVKWPSSSYLATAWAQNKDGMFGFHERSLTGVHIEVVDSHGNPVPDFDVSVDTANRTVHYSGGFAHRVTTDGPQNITVSVGGHDVARLATTARAFDGRFDRVVLAR